MSTTCHRYPGCGRKHLWGVGKHSKAFWSPFLWGTQSGAENRLRESMLSGKSNIWGLYGQPITDKRKLRSSKGTLLIAFTLHAFILQTYLGTLILDILNHWSIFLHRNAWKCPGPTFLLLWGLWRIFALYSGFSLRPLFSSISNEPIAYLAQG